MSQKKISELWGGSGRASVEDNAEENSESGQTVPNCLSIRRAILSQKC